MRILGVAAAVMVLSLGGAYAEENIPPTAPKVGIAFERVLPFDPAHPPLVFVLRHGQAPLPGEPGILSVIPTPLRAPGEAVPPRELALEREEPRAHLPVYLFKDACGGSWRGQTLPGGETIRLVPLHLGYLYAPEGGCSLLKDETALAKTLSEDFPPRAGHPAPTAAGVLSGLASLEREDSDRLERQRRLAEEVAWFERSLERERDKLRHLPRAVIAPPSPVFSP